MPRNRRQPGKEPREKPREAVRPKRNTREATSRVPEQQQKAPERTAKSRTRAAKPGKARARTKSRESEALEETETQQPETAESALEPEIDEIEVAEAAPAIAEPEVLPPARDEETTLPVPVERDLARADALQRYMSDVSRHPLLTREEEHDLAVKFRDTQDPAIAYRLVTANLRLVVKIAHEYRRAAFSLLDLIQEGNVGLMQAVQKYDPYRGVKLSSYAAWWIRAYILRYLMDNWRMVKLGTTQAQRKLFFNLRKEQERLLSQGFEAAPRLLAELPPATGAVPAPCAG